MTEAYRLFSVCVKISPRVMFTYLTDTSQGSVKFVSQICVILELANHKNMVTVSLSMAHDDDDWENTEYKKSNRQTDRRTNRHTAGGIRTQTRSFVKKRHSEKRKTLKTQCDRWSLFRSYKFDRN